MTLQAWFDDSGTKGTGRIMAMGGVFGEAEAIAALADEWDRHLVAAHPGAIHGAFKMDDACTLDGVFRHWRENNRDAKVHQMATVIDRSDVTVVGRAIDLAAFGRVFRADSWVPIGKHSLSQPYILLLEQVLYAVVTLAVAQGSEKPMEIVFDNHLSFKNAVLSGYDRYLEVENSHPERRAVMPVQPWFRDDNDWTALQAADLLAGDMRLLEEKRLGVEVPPVIGNLPARLYENRDFRLYTLFDVIKMSAYVRGFGQDYIDGWMDGLRDSGELG